jgi:glycosyltransferase involved in cell wall biosynthesis
MNPRVLMLNHSATMGGAEYGLLDVAIHLRDNALVVLLEDGPFRETLEGAGVAVRVVNAGAIHGVRRDSALPGAAALLGLWHAARDVADIARDFDVIHANSQKALMVGGVAALRSQVPMMWHLHDIIDPPWFSRANILADVLVANRCADRVVAVSKATAAAIVRHGLHPSRVRVVYNGIDPATVVLDPDRSASVRAEFGLADVPVVGCFSRLAGWKGQDVLVEAIAGLPGVHLLLVGGPLFNEHAYERELQQLVSRLGVADRVHFAGHRRDVPLLMQSVDLVVHPSTAPEPFARTLVESMLAGKAPIASACGGVPELIESGKTGHLFRPGDVAELRATLERLLASPGEVETVARAAREHALQHFSLSDYVHGIADHLRATASLHRRPDGQALTAEPST